VGEENGGVLLDGDGTGEVGSGHGVLENGNYVEDSESQEGGCDSPRAIAPPPPPLIHFAICPLFPGKGVIAPLK